MKIPSGKILYRPGLLQDDDTAILRQEAGVFFCHDRGVGEDYGADHLFGGTALNCIFARIGEPTCKIAVLTFDGFNEIDSFVAAHILNRLRPQGWRAFITSPDAVIRSTNGVVVHAERPLEFAGEADAMIIGSGSKTFQIAENLELLGRIRLDPIRQLVGSQCSGALLLAKLGLLEGRPVCTDLNTKKWVVESGVAVIDQPFYAEGNVATAGGCLASQYLATWIMLRARSREHAETALQRVTPVGQQADYIARAIGIVEPYLPPTAIASAA